jgi:hypothetical protein
MQTPGPVRSLFAVLLLLASSLAAIANPAAPAVRAEIDSLLGKLQSSGCEFYRNGSWHNGAEAKAHLLVKLEYLEARNAVPSTERFIELGASSSSFSGQPYRVKCGAAAPIDSSIWLSAELKALRSAAKGQASPAR